MKKSLLIGAGLALLAGGGVALAQMPPGGPGGPDGRMERHGPPGWGPREHMEMRMARMMDRGAHFRLKKGDQEIDIKCAENEPMQACVSAATTLLDKVGTTAPKTP